MFFRGSGVQRSRRPRPHRQHTFAFPLLRVHPRIQVAVPLLCCDHSVMHCVTCLFAVGVLPFAGVSVLFAATGSVHRLLCFGAHCASICMIRVGGRGCVVLQLRFGFPCIVSSFAWSELSLLSLAACSVVLRLRFDLTAFFFLVYNLRIVPVTSPPVSPTFTFVSPKGRGLHQVSVLQIDKNWYTNESVWSLSFLYPDLQEDLDEKESHRPSTKALVTPRATSP